jgi:hypothetical protein
LTDKQRTQTAARQQRFRERQAQVRRTEQLAKGLPALPVIPTLPGWPRWNASFLAAQELIACSLGEMQGYFEDRSESWQESQRGDDHQEKIASVEAIMQALGDLLS